VHWNQGKDIPRALTGGIVPTYRQKAWEVALGQYGYITTKDAIANGIPPVELPKLAARGRLRHVARGIYRFDEMPTTHFDQFFEAVLRVGDDAYLTGDAVLALHDLALVNPRKIRVATRQRTRRNLPPWVKVERANIPEQDVVFYEGIPTTTVAQAMRQAQNYVMRERLLEALPKAINEGLVTKGEMRTLKKELTGVVQ